MNPAAFVMTEGKFYPTTISLIVNFLAPACPGLLIAEAKVIQIGKTIAFMKGKLTAKDGTALATATTVARLLETAKVIRDATRKKQAAWNAMTISLRRARNVPS